MYTITLPEYFGGPIDSPVSFSSPLQSTLYTVTFVTVVQLLTHVQLFATPWTAACQASLSITNSRSFSKLMSIESVMPSNHLIFCHRLLPPSIFPSLGVFSNESALRIRWPKYCLLFISFELFIVYVWLYLSVFLLFAPSSTCEKFYFLWLLPLYLFCSCENSMLNIDVFLLCFGDLLL